MKTRHISVALIAIFATFPAMTQTHGRFALNDSYLSSQRDGIELSLTKCPGGNGKIFVIGTRPDTNRCVNVHYRINYRVYGMGGAAHYDSIKNFVGGESCYGDSKAIPNSEKYEVEQLGVAVEDVSYCQ